MMTHLKLLKMPKRRDARERYFAAEQEILSRFTSHGRTDVVHIKKSALNERFGDRQATLALAQFFALDRVGDSLRHQVSTYRPKQTIDLNDRARRMVESKIKAPVGSTLRPLPNELTKKSTVNVDTSMVREAVEACVRNNWLGLIDQVKLLGSRDEWEVRYVLRSERWFAVWPVSLSQFPNEIRSMLIKGRTFDLEAAIGQFLAAKTLRPKFQEEFKEARKYLGDPRGYRSELSRSLGLPEDVVKNGLHSITLGANTHRNHVINGRSCLTDTMTVDDALEFSKATRKLQLDLKRMMHRVAPDSSEFAKKYFRWESEVIDALTSESGIGDHFHIHDGLEGLSAADLSKISQAADKSNLRYKTS